MPKRRIPIRISQPRRSKYNAVRCNLDGHGFDSKREMARYCELKLMQQAGAIRNLMVHVNYSLKVNGQMVGVYEADFVYEAIRDCREWIPVVEDVKGVRTSVYRLKKKLMKTLYNIEIKEI